MADGELLSTREKILTTILAASVLLFSFQYDPIVIGSRLSEIARKGFGIKPPQTEPLLTPTRFVPEIDTSDPYISFHVYFSSPPLPDDMKFFDNDYEVADFTREVIDNSLDNILALHSALGIEYSRVPDFFVVPGTRGDERDAWYFDEGIFFKSEYKKMPGRFTEDINQVYDSRDDFASSIRGLMSHEMAHHYFKTRADDIGMSCWDNYNFYDGTDETFCLVVLEEGIARYLEVRSRDGPKQEEYLSIMDDTIFKKVRAEERLDFRYEMGFQVVRYLMDRDSAKAIDIIVSNPPTPSDIDNFVGYRDMLMQKMDVEQMHHETGQLP